MVRAVMVGVNISALLAFTVVPMFFDILDAFTLAKAFIWIKAKIRPGVPDERNLL